MNPTQPLEISELARKVAIKERQLDAEFDKRRFGQFTQLALNQSRAADAETIATKNKRIEELEWHIAGHPQSTRPRGQLMPSCDVCNTASDGITLQQNQIATLELRILELREALEMAFKSANPSPTEHPSMFAAWCKMNAALSSTPSPVGWVRREAIDKLLNYPIEHRPSCDQGISPGKTCSCGLSQAITDARRELEPKA